jgi:WD40 repeat protein
MSTTSGDRSLSTACIALDDILTRRDFAVALTMVRDQAGLTVRDVARAAGLPDSTVGGYYSGRHLPASKPPTILVSILHACGVTDPAEIDQWLRTLSRVRLAPGRRPAGAPVPYRGLQSYGVEDAEWFFGREALTEAVLRRLAELCQEGGPLVVLGASGAGKSSLLRAGVVPAIGAGNLGPGPAKWHCVQFTPGANPMRTLQAQLPATSVVRADWVTAANEASDRQPAPPMPPAATTRQLPADDAGIDQATSPDASGEPSRLVLIVDQFEEIFTLCPDDDERQAFITALLALTSAGTPLTDAHDRQNALVMIGLRADFFPHAMRYRELIPALQVPLIVGQMTETELRSAIVEPARKAKLDVDEGLVQIILRDLAPPDASAAHDVGALPLLSHALLATWHGAQRGRLTESAYRESGGISGAVALTADRVYEELSTGQRDVARRLFLRLVQVNADSADTRRRVRRDELVDEESAAEASDFAEILGVFVRERLITVGSGSVEVTHEALLWAWPRLRDWLDADRAGLRTHRQLTDAAYAWQEAAREPANLYRGGRLSAAQEWAEDPTHQADLNTLEREFLDESVAEQTRENDRARRRLRRRYRVVALLAVLALATLSVTAYARQLAVSGDRDRAKAAQDRAQSLSRLIANEADRLRDKDVSLSMQLALVAYRIAQTPEARSSLLNSTAVPAATRLRPPAGAAKSVAATMQGDLLAAGTKPGPVQLWSVRNGRPDHEYPELTGPTDEIVSLAFSSDGHLLAAGGYDKKIHLWDTTNPTQPSSLAALTGPADEILSVAVSADGRRVAAASGSIVYLWDIRDHDRPAPAIRLEGAAKTVRALAFSPDGSILAAGSNDARVHLWNVRDTSRPTTLGSLTGPTSRVFSIAISPNGRLLAAGTAAEHNIYLWDISQPAHPRREGSPLTGPSSWVNTVTFSPDSHTLAAGSSDRLLWLFDTKSHQPIAQLPHPEPVTRAAYVTSHSMATVATDGTVRTWALPGPLIIGANDSIFTVSYDASGHKLGVGPGGADNTTTVWDPTDTQHPVPLGPPIANTTEDQFSGAGALTPDGRTFAVGDAAGNIQLWDITNQHRP